MNDRLASAAAAVAERLQFLNEFSQAGRLLKVSTVLPTGALVPEQVHILDAMNQPLALELDAFSPSAHFDLKAVLGEQLTLQLLCSDGSYRPWHGYVLQAAQLGSDGGLARYRLSMRPWLSFLAQRRDSFVYQDKTAIQIVEDVFKDYPQAQWRVDVTEPLRVRSLCCQYRESDFAFVTRLLAEEGLNYWFEQLDGDAAAQAQRAGQAMHRLVIADTRAQRPQLGRVRFAQARDSASRASAAQVDTLTRLSAIQAAGPTATTVGSWDYKRLQGVTGQDQTARAPGELPPLEHYDGSGAYRYENTEHAQRAATIALQRHEQHYRRLRGQGSVRFARPGADITISEHGALDGPCTLLQVEHHIVNNLGSQAARLTGRADLDKGSYRCELLAQPADVPVVPDWQPKPTAPGCQTALVVGVQGEPVTNERDHRIKLQFPWQRGQNPNPGGLPHDGSIDEQGNAPGNERSGTWVRVAEHAAGANWGQVFTPRIGTEVLVEFIEGDIDRPVVVGQLHNGQDRPPFAGGQDSGANHPGVISGIHSPSLDRSGYNEWSLDHATGQLRMRLLTSYSLAEVGIGHLIAQGPGAAQRGSARGAGFEVSTQGWTTLRAAQGLLISTTARQGSYSSAQSTQMDSAEALAQLNAAHDLAQRLSGAAQPMGAQPLTPHEPQQTLDKHLKTVDPQQDGKYEGAVNGQAAQKANAPRQLTDPVERPATPSITLDSANTLAMASEASISGYAGQDQAWVAQGDWHEAAAHTHSLVAGRTASWYTHQGDLQIKAANGPVSLRAHTDTLEILAAEQVQVISVNDEITISAQKRIELIGGDSSVVLDGGDITFITPGSFTVKAATHEWMGGAALGALLPTLPAGGITPATLPDLDWYDERFHLVNAEGDPLPHRPYRITADNGQVWEGVSDAEGMTERVFTRFPSGLTVQILPALAARTIE